MRLIGQARRGGHLCRRESLGEKGFGAPQADRHQHLMRRDVKMGFELALEMVRAERHHLRQLVEGQGVHIVVMEIVAHALEAMRPFFCDRRMARQRLEGINQIQQQALLRQRIVGMP